MIYNKLNFKEHIQKLEGKVSRSVGILSKLKFYLPESALLNFITHWYIRTNLRDL